MTKLITLYTFPVPCQKLIKLHSTSVIASGQDYLVIAEIHSRDMIVLLSTNIGKKHFRFVSDLFIALLLLLSKTLEKYLRRSSFLFAGCRSVILLKKNSFSGTFPEF